MATLRDLNPELMKPATPAHRAFDLKVPQGRADGAAACLGSVTRVKTHVVRRGGVTLASVAEQYGTRVADLARVNGLVTHRKMKLARGTELIIPMPGRRILGD